MSPPAENDDGRPRRGRPSGKRGTFSFRVTDRLRSRLEQTARAEQRPVSEEIELRLEQSFLNEELFSLLFGEQDVAVILKAIGSVIKEARSYAHSRRFNEEETRRTIRAAIETLLDIHLWSGGDIKPLPQTLRVEGGKILPRPVLKPEEAGRYVATESLIFHQDVLIDELGQPLVKRWSRRGSPPGAKEKADWPEGEWQTLTKTEARASLRKARSKSGQGPDLTKK
jgi:hypothetical protein